MKRIGDLARISCHEDVSRSLPLCVRGLPWCDDATNRDVRIFCDPNDHGGRKSRNRSQGGRKRQARGVRGRMFLGRRGRVPPRAGRRRDGAGILGRPHGEPDVRRRLHAHDRPRRGGARRIRSREGLLRQAPPSVLDDARPDAGEPPGPRLRRQLPQRRSSRSTTSRPASRRRRKRKSSRSTTSPSRRRSRRCVYSTRPKPSTSSTASARATTPARSI